jgi:hypothetical protein
VAPHPVSLVSVHEHSPEGCIMVTALAARAAMFDSVFAVAPVHGVGATGPDHDPPMAWHFAASQKVTSPPTAQTKS